jgi:hypothetical protein
MAPFLVAAFDIECTSRTATSRPVKGYEKTARELVIWAGEQMQAPQGEGLRRHGGRLPGRLRTT